MVRFEIVVALCCLFNVRAIKDSPRIIIIGSGPASIAAGARLLENGFNNLTILEAENRIGGRLYTTEFGGYPVDLGGQWVAGEKNNVVLELVWPLGLLEKTSEEKRIEIFSSAGSKIAENASDDLINFFINLTESDVPEKYTNETIGDWFVPAFEEYFKQHSEIMENQRRPLLNMFCLTVMANHAGDDWFNVSPEPDIEDDGDQTINWKDKTYGFVIDILLKKFPNPAEELPFRNKTILNSEVSQINYNNSDGAIRVVTTKGEEYVADHVIFTPSLGVLKSDHEKLFNPPLPEVKINAIKGIEFGNVAKIYLFYPEPWWPQINGLFVTTFYWTDEDKNAFANDPEKSWLLGIYSVINIEHKPGLLCCWLAGVHAREMENVSENSVLNGTKELLRRFLGKAYNLTEPSAILRTQWYTNKHFRGTYSYRSPATHRLGATASHLAEPIMGQEYPQILFAGEATNTDQYGTVHGAISTGWREADRLIGAYGNEKTTPETRR